MYVNVSGIAMWIQIIKRKLFALHTEGWLSFDFCISTLIKKNLGKEKKAILYECFIAGL